MKLLQPIGIVLGANLLESLVHNMFWTVDTPVRGSVVYCDLGFGIIEHSGIYIGNNQIVHLNGQGDVEIVSPEEFMRGCTAISIYVSCDSEGDAVGYDDVAENALGLVGYNVGYSFWRRNCHQFCSYCLSIYQDNMDVTLNLLKMEAKKQLNATQWRVWKR